MKALLLTVFLILSLNALAGEKGNGGDGYYTSEGLVLFDLFESGAYRNTFVEDVEPRSAIKRKVDAVLITDKEAARILAVKLEMIHRKYPVAGQLLTDILSAYKFRFIDSELVNVKDTCSFVKIDEKKLVQLAVRDQQTVYVDNLLWNKLDNVNKAALMLHELIYSFEKDKRCSEKTRVIVSEVFLPTFNDLSLNNFLSLLNGTEFEKFPAHTLDKSYFLKVEEGSSKTYINNEVTVCGQSQYQKKNRYSNRTEYLTKPRVCKVFKLRDTKIDIDTFCGDIPSLGEKYHVGSIFVAVDSFNLDSTVEGSSISLNSTTYVMHNSDDTFTFYEMLGNPFHSESNFESVLDCKYSLGRILTNLK